MLRFRSQDVQEQDDDDDGDYDDGGGDGDDGDGDEDDVSSSSRSSRSSRSSKSSKSSSKSKSNNSTSRGNSRKTAVGDIWATLRRDPLLYLWKQPCVVSTDPELMDSFRCSGLFGPPIKCMTVRCVRPFPTVLRLS